MYATGVNSGTSGLPLCVRAMGIGEGDEVITTPFSFVSTTNCLLFERARPVFVDVDPESYNMDPGAIESAITPSTRAILPVEVFGNTAHFDEYERIAEKHGLSMIEDCCEALGGALGGRATGSFGDCGVFAFYPNKQITTGEGGMIVTDNADIRDLCVSMRNQGRATPQDSAGDASRAPGSGWLTHARLGYNYRLSEMSAVLGEMQIKRLDEILEKRRRVARMYDQALADIDGVHLPPMVERDSASWFVYVIRLSDRFAPEDRDSVLENLRGRGVSCRNYFVPIHTQPYIAKMLGTEAGDFPVTERISARTIALPFFGDLTSSQIERIRETLISVLQR